MGMRLFYIFAKYFNILKNHWGMNYCKCGKLIADNEKYCDACGHKYRLRDWMRSPYGNEHWSQRKANRMSVIMMILVPAVVIVTVLDRERNSNNVSAAANTEASAPLPAPAPTASITAAGRVRAKQVIAHAVEKYGKDVKFGEQTMEAYYPATTVYVTKYRIRVDGRGCFGVASLKYNGGEPFVLGNWSVNYADVQE